MSQGPGQVLAALAASLLVLIVVMFVANSTAAPRTHRSRFVSNSWPLDPSAKAQTEGSGTNVNGVKNPPDGTAPPVVRGPSLAGRFIPCTAATTPRLPSKGRMRVLYDNLSAAQRATNVTFFLAQGSALGWYRECGIIPHTTDADVGVRVQDYSPQLRTHMERAGFSFLNTHGRMDLGYEVKFRRNGSNIDFFLMYEEVVTARLASLSKGILKEGQLVYYAGLWSGHNLRKLYAPACTYPYAQGKMYETTFQVPGCSLDYMKMAFGRRWNVSQPSHHWWNGRDNVFETIDSRKVPRK